MDAGDAYCPHGQAPRSHRNIEDKVADVLRAGAFPVVIGGDHSITHPAATAVASKYGWGKVGLLHFDAHADTADSIEGNLHSHGTPMRRLIESGAIRGRNFVQVGLRGYWPPPEVFDWMREQEMTWHLMHEVWDRGLRPVIADAIARASDGCDWLYLSVDIDVLDPGLAPGTGTPEPGGMNTADLLRAVRSIVLETPVVALDVVEVAPAYDHAETTVNAAHRVVLETLGALAHKKRQRAGGPVTRPGRPRRRPPCGTPSSRRPGRDPVDRATPTPTPTCPASTTTTPEPGRLRRSPASQLRRNRSDWHSPPMTTTGPLRQRPGVVECQLHGSSP